ncbi:MAG: hypothetical protein ABL964_02170 [Steroidobacteraceae bacterium]
MAAKIRFTSFVEAVERGNLEALVFFNASQDRVLDGIIEAIDKFGPPEIVEEGAKLRVRVTGKAEAQSLFAIDAVSGRPLGIAVYLRSDLENIAVLHLGIAEEFAANGPLSGEHLLFRLLRELRRCSRRLKGVRRMEVIYLSGRNGPKARAGIRKTPL